MAQMARENAQSWQGKQIRVEIPFSRAGVAQHVWIESGDGSVLVDVGDGILRDILQNRFDLNKLRGVVFTHGHFDHMGGLHSFLGYLRMIGRKEPLPICAPKGCAEVFSTLDSFLKCYPNTIPFEVVSRGVEPNEEFRLGAFAIKAYPVVHCGSIDGAGILDPIPALGYRITHTGETIAITGDTGISSPLKELIEGADLAIIEATYRESAEAGRESLKRVHLSEDVAKEIGKLAREFILVHKGKG
jgi:ribonuclease BN (tRNA processing enzyme)